MKRSRVTFELAIKPKQKGDISHEWLRDSIRQAIQSGSLKPGQRLPGSRDLARAYKVARGTMLLALDALRDEGYVHSVRGSGTYVSEDLPEGFLTIARPVTKPVASAIQVTRLSNYGQRLRNFSHFVTPRAIAFRVNLPALDLFPTDIWAQVASRRIRRATTANLLGCEPQGFLPLRNALCDYLQTARAVVCSPEQIIITSGIQESLDMTARILINPGEKVLMEDPGYQVAFAVFEATGARIVSMPLDRNGAAPSAESFAGARLMYVTPGHQFPTGVTMPVRRRTELLRLARQERTFIFEDDYDSEFRYSGSPLPALQSIDKDGLVIFAGSFNKVLFPSLRMGYVVVPPSLLEAFKTCKLIHSRHHPVLEQAIVCDFIEQGHFSRHLRRMRKIYAERLEVLSHEMRKRLSGALDLSQIEAGLQTLAWLKTQQSSEEVAASALKLNVDVVPLSRYCRASMMRDALQVGFAAIDAEAIAKGVEILAGILN